MKPIQIKSNKLKTKLGLGKKNDMSTAASSQKAVMSPIQFYQSMEKYHRLKMSVLETIMRGGDIGRDRHILIVQEHIYHYACWRICRDYLTKYAQHEATRSN